MYRTIQPAILLWGTPVVSISTANDDGTLGLAPVSSVFGRRCRPGRAASSQAVRNLMRAGERAPNLPSAHEADAIDRRAVGEPDPSQKGRIAAWRSASSAFTRMNPIMMAGEPRRIDSDAWRPALMSLQQSRLGGRLRPSRLATIPGCLYRAGDGNRGSAGRTDNGSAAFDGPGASP